MYIKRKLEEQLLKLINRKEIIAIIGPRQSGKTTIMKKIFNSLKKAIFIDFEDRKILDIFNEDIDLFIELYVKNNDYLFIDEFQYSKNGGQKLKYIYDKYNIKIFISGSSATELSVEGIKYLTGRVFVFNLYPLSFQEFILYKNEKLAKLIKNKLSKQLIEQILPLFYEFIIYGGYPNVVLAKTNEEKELVLKNIYNTYLLKEIRQILNIEDDYKLSKLIKIFSLQTSNLLNYTDISNITGFTNQDLLKKINILEKTFICQRAIPFFNNKKTELVKIPKIFFFDNGFRNIAIENFQNINLRVDKGEIYENFIATELIKKDIQLKFWRTKSKAEVDFIIEKNGKLFSLEIKSNLITPKITKSFREFIFKYNPDFKYIFSEKLYCNKENINFLPIFYLPYVLDI
jgi:uncharacterized protein